MDEIKRSDLLEMLESMEETVKNLKKEYIEKQKENMQSFSDGQLSMIEILKDTYKVPAK